MKWVYTDERFPGYRIENHGTCKFYLMQGEELVQTFTSSENVGCAEVSDEFARRRADHYFDSWSKFDPTSEINAQNWRSPNGKAIELPKVKPQDLERLLAAIAAEQNPEKKKEMQQRAIRMMAREESLAEQTVAHLLYER